MDKQKVVSRQHAAASSSFNQQIQHHLEALVWLMAAENRRMTYQEFLSWADEDTLAEWVNGEVLMTSPASTRHQKLCGFLANILQVFTRYRDLGVVMTAPFQMKLENGREPDILFVKTAHVDRLQATYLEGPADMVVEVISPESIGRDRGDKFYEYAQGGVPEYWLVDPQRQQAEFYELVSGYYQVRFSGHKGRYEALTLPEFWMRVEWLWEDPLRSPIRALAEIVGMDAAVMDAFEQALMGQGGKSTE